MNKKKIQDYIDKHESTYQSKYKYHSSYQMNQNCYKFHYYMRDSQLQQINIFFEILLEDEISVKFAENLHDYEQVALTIEALKVLERYIDEKTSLSCDAIKDYIDQDASSRSIDSLTNQDLINILNYLEYHRGTTQKSIDQFYEIYIPYVQKLLDQLDYKTFLKSINMLCDEILYEHFWQGINLNYMDQEYYFHLYYFRKIIEMCINHIDIIYIRARKEIEDLMVRLFDYQRFTFCMISVLDDIVCNKYIVDAFFSMLSTRFKLIKERGDEGNLAYSYLYSFYIGDEQMQEKYREIFFESVVDDILTIMNHDMQIALGNYLLKTGGYEILLNLFKKDHNSYIFKCFPIEDIPTKLHGQVKRELVNTLKYYSKLMDEPQYRLGSLEQIMNINRLILEYFKEDIYEN